jgi:hypothetical protein
VEKIVTEAPISPHRYHLRTSDDLVTTPAETRSGFIALAIEKNRQGTPFVERARRLRQAAQKARTPADLLTMPDIRSELLTAAGLSDKALAHLQPADQTEAVFKLIKDFLEPAGDAFVEELVARFLLTRGDTVGGSMRNVGGFLAQQKFTRAMFLTLQGARGPYWLLDAGARQWREVTENDVGSEPLVRGLSWRSRRGPRTILYNLTVPIVKSNIDLCLFDVTPNDWSARSAHEPASYVALGEIKGGIDPAGADEHWKTASTALSRIRAAFANRGYTPHTFFIGAAIERRMAAEIWNQLESESLANAANLNRETQVASLVRWLIQL